MIAQIWVPDCLRVVGGVRFDGRGRLDSLRRLRCVRFNFRRIRTEIADPQDQIRHKRLPCGSIDLIQQIGFEVGQLLQPDGMLDVYIEFLEPDLIGPGVGRDLLADNLAPPSVETDFQQLAFKTQAVSQAG